MKTLMMIAAIVALPSVAAAQQLGNSMGTQASATPSSSNMGNSSPNGMTSGMSHSRQSTHHRRSHTSHLTNSDKSTSGNIAPH